MPTTTSSKDNSRVALPERWKRGRQRAALSCLAAVMVVAIALSSKAGVDDLDSWWLRARFALREAIDGPERDGRIALVLIDDRSYDKWNSEPLFLWGGHFADAIRQLTRSGARVIALDWTQTVPVDQRFGVKNDEKLGEALSQASNPVLVKLIRPDGAYTKPIPALLYALPEAYKDEGESSLGFADTGDQYNTGLWSFIYPYVPSPKREEYSFAARIVEKSKLADPKKVHVRRDGTMLIHFGSGAGKKGREATFDTASLYDVATAKEPDPRWKGKIVLIGEDAKGSNDKHYVPVLAGLTPSGLTEARQLPGVEVQAHAVATLLDDAAIEEPPLEAMWLLSALAGALGTGAFALWNWSRAVFATIGVALSWAAFSLLLFCVDNFALPLIAPLAVLLLGAGFMGAYRAFSEERERAQVLTTWGRYQDPRLIEALLEHPEWRSGHGEKREVTVLFADLKSFTQTVEHLTPDRALEVLNRYLALFSGTILEHGGIVDKFLGDGLMAQWGAPAPREDHADAAVAACLAIEAKLRDLNQHLSGRDEVGFEARLTLHSGPVVAGPLGSDDRLEYTIIGDTVNVTSRMQETAKAMNCDFLISESTRELLSTAVVTGQETEVSIRGRDRPLVVFEVLGTTNPSPPPAEPAVVST